MIKLNIHEIKTQFSKYIEMVEAGDTVVVCKRNVPVAEIRPIEKKKKRKPIFGSARGMVAIPPDFNELPADLLKLFYEGGDNDPLREFAPQYKRRQK
jgi:prevent-host-death family protein